MNQIQITRKEMYQIIKELQLQNLIQARYNKYYSQCTNSQIKDFLIEFDALDYIYDTMPIVKYRTKLKVKNNNIQEVKRLKQSVIDLTNILMNNNTITFNESKYILRYINQQNKELNV